MEVLGIEVHADGIRGAIVDCEQGQTISKVKSVDPSKTMEPHKLISKIHKLVKKFDWKGPIGCAFPAPVQKGTVLSTTGVHESWLDVDIAHLFSEITNDPVLVIKESDAIGLAEMKFGTGKKKKGTIIILNIDDGVSSSVFFDGKLVPNVSLGFVEQKGISVEERVSNKTRKKEGITHKIWGRRLQYILEHYEKMFHPNMFILGGTVAKKSDKIFPYIKLNTRFKAAALSNDASIIGAALYASNIEPVRREF